MIFLFKVKPFCSSIVHCLVRYLSHLLMPGMRGVYQELTSEIRSGFDSSVIQKLLATKSGQFKLIR